MPFVKAGRLRQLEADQAELKKVQAMTSLEFEIYRFECEITQNSSEIARQLNKDFWESPASGKVQSIRSLMNG